MKKSVVFIGIGLIIISVSAMTLKDFKSEKNPKKEISKIENPVEKTEEDLAKENFEIRNTENFDFDYGTRFAPITRAELENLNGFSSLLNTEEQKLIKKVKSVDIIQVINEERSDIKLTSLSNDLTDAQTKFLKTAPVSTSFVLNILYERFKNIGPSNEKYLFTPHYTIVPDSQAYYINGKEEFINFLYTQTQFERLSVVKKKLNAAKLYFTITNDGKIENIRLDRTSGYPLIDQKLKTLVKETEGDWQPAKDSFGNFVDQELVISFGVLGC